MAGSGPTQGDPAALPARQLLSLFIRRQAAIFCPSGSYCVETYGRKEGLGFGVLVCGFGFFSSQQGETGARGPPGFPGKVGPKVRAVRCLRAAPNSPRPLRQRQAGQLCWAGHRAWEILATSIKGLRGERGAAGPWGSCGAMVGAGRGALTSLSSPRPCQAPLGHEVLPAPR